MNYLIVIFTACSFVFTGFSQVETTVWNGKTYYVYPHQEQLENADTYMMTLAEYREIPIRDDKNRKVVSVQTEPVDPYYRQMYKQEKMTKDRKKQEKFIRELMNKRPELFYNLGTLTERNITPSLEPIPDGDYIQYYRDLPYLDGNTIRYRNNTVAAVFHIRNNIPEGDAKWFTPNGMVLKTGNYTAGSRNGKWMWFSYEPALSKIDLKKEEQAMDYLLNGQLTYDTMAESYQFRDGLKNGPYTYEFNSRLKTSGSYKNDKESGSWVFSEFQYVADGRNSRQTDTLIVVKSYTIPEKPIRGKSVIIRNEVIADEFRYLDEFPGMNPTDTASLVLYNNGIFSTDAESYFVNFDEYYLLAIDEKTEEGLELPEEVINSYEGEDYEAEPYAVYTENDYREQMYYGNDEGAYFVNGKYYTTNELIDSAGYEFLYDSYEEHYRNGQLKYHFEVKNGVLVEEDTVFWDNGQAANTVSFDPAKHLYTQHFFDYNGKLYQTREFDEKGNAITGEKKDYDMLIDGIPYQISDNLVLTYVNRKGLENGLTERTLIKKGLWMADSTVSMASYLDPATQTLDLTEYSIQHDPYYTQQAVFGEDYDNVNAVTNLHLQELRLERTISGSLYDFSGYLNMFGIIDTLNPQANVLDWANNYETQSDDILYRKNVPFTGKFELKTNSSGYKIKSGESSISVELPGKASEFKLLGKALKKYAKKGKKSAILELYNQDMSYSVLADNVYMVFPFVNDFFRQNPDEEYYDIDYEEGYSSKPAKIKQIAPFNHVLSGQLLNGKPEGEWIAKDQYGNITGRVFYTKGNLEGKATHYATEFPLSAEESYVQNQYVQKYHTYVFDPAPEKKVRYVQQSETYKNGRLNGPVIVFNWKGDTTSYTGYKEGFQHGLSFQRSKLFYAIASFEDGRMDGISRTYMTIPGRDSILIFDLNFQNGTLQGESKSYHTNGKLAKRGFFLAGQPIDDYEAFDTLGARYQYVKFQFNQPVEEKIWEENQLSVRYLFDWKDSIDFHTSDIAGSTSFERLAVDLGLIRDPYSEPYFGRPSLVDKSGINYTITKYYPNDRIAREGQISKGKKTGHWKYFSYEGTALYEVDYFDTIIAINDSIRFKSKGIMTYLDAQRKPVSKSYIIEKVEKYDCSHADHNEERMLYTFWERDSSVHRINGYVKNYYDNGAIQNEGMVENGIPTGIWKMYDSDGNLNQVGTYRLGKRDGRWLSGDLGNVKNMSEICLNPNLSNLEEIMAYQEKLLDISVIYYSMGKGLKREYYGINLNNGEAPDSFYGEE